MKVGITGHQQLGDVLSESQLNSIIVKLISEYAVTHGYSSLAIGADQIFVQSLIQSSVPFTAIIPCRDYESTFLGQDSLSRYGELLSMASDMEILDYENPSGDAFYDAGKRVCDHAELVIAIWNGKPAAGRGGTADAVEYALSIGKPVLHINNLDLSVKKLDGLSGISSDG